MDWSQWGPGSSPTSRPVTSLPKVPATAGLVIEDASTGFTGAVLRVEKSGGVHLVVLEGRRNATRSFPLGKGFLLEGKPVELVDPASVARTAQTKPSAQRTASGSRAVAAQRAKVAKASRIWVEGIHDAELIEKIWGDDLRVEGIVVEPLHGVDDLAGAVAEFSPGPQRKLAVLVDHLVEGSKESRIAAEVIAQPGTQDNVLIVGHPYVDIWQAIKPQVLGRQAWPTIPRSVEWKKGILSWLGLPHETAEDIGLGWKAILGRVRNYADLEPELLGRVEHMIDFVTITDQ